MSALYGAVTAASIARNQDDAAGDAYVLAACTSAIVLHLAVRKAIRTKGLPKPLAVLVGSNEDIPFSTRLSPRFARPWGCCRKVSP